MARSTSRRVPGARRQSKERRPPASLGSWRAGRASDIDRLFHWYLEPDPQPFFIEIAGPTPGLDRRAFASYCRDQSAFWLRPTAGAVDGLALLTYIQPVMRVANLDLRLRTLPEPGSPEALELKGVIRALCLSAGVLKTQLLAFSGDARRQDLAESLGMVREGLLRQHFYHASAYHDLVLYGHQAEVAHV